MPRVPNSRIPTQDATDTVENFTENELQDTLDNIRTELSRESISQQVFAKATMDRTRGILSQMLKHGGAGYERHIATIKRFLQLPREVRREIYIQTYFKLQSEKTD